VEIQREFDQRAPLLPKAFAKQFAHAAESRAHSRLSSLSGQLVELGIAQHTRSELLVALIPGVELFQAPANPFPACCETCPPLDVRQWVSLERKARARVHEAPLIGEMSIECVPLDPRALGDLRDGRSRRPQGAMQLKGGLGDALAGSLL